MAQESEHSSSSGQADQAGTAQDMPVPTTFSASAGPVTEATGQMPVPGMKMSEATGQMPVPGMKAASETSMMPMPPTGMAGKLEQQPQVGNTSQGGTSPGGGDTMPRPDSGRSGLPRFGGPGGIVPSGPSYEPGVVEVQFREGVAPSVRAGADGPPAEVHSAATGPLTELNRILADNHLVKAEPTFLTTHEEASAVQASAAAQGVETPHLAHFVTLHFADDADTVAIAARIDALPEVEKAIASTHCVATDHHCEPPRARGGSRASTAVGQPAVQSRWSVPVGPWCWTPSTGLENQWYVFRCDVNHGWSRSTGYGVVIADVDWGCRTSHQDLAPKIVKTYNAFDGTTDVTHGGSVFHGTGVMGLTGAAVNSLGMAGIRVRSRALGGAGRLGDQRGARREPVGAGHRLGAHHRQRWQAQGRDPRGADGSLRQLRAGAVGERGHQDRDRRWGGRLRSGRQW